MRCVNGESSGGGEVRITAAGIWPALDLGRLIAKRAGRTFKDLSDMNEIQIAGPSCSNDSSGVGRFHTLLILSVSSMVLVANEMYLCDRL